MEIKWFDAFSTEFDGAAVEANIKEVVLMDVGYLFAETELYYHLAREVQLSSDYKDIRFCMNIPKVNTIGIKFYKGKDGVERKTTKRA